MHWSTSCVISKSVGGKTSGVKREAPQKISRLKTLLQGRIPGKGSFSREWIRFHKKANAQVGAASAAKEVVPISKQQQSGSYGWNL